MARRSMKDVYFYVDLLNAKLAEFGKDIEYVAHSTCGHKALVIVGQNGCTKWERHGYTTGEIYEVVYNMYEMLCRF